MYSTKTMSGFEGLMGFDWLSLCAEVDWRRWLLMVQACSLTNHNNHIKE